MTVLYYRVAVRLPAHIKRMGEGGVMSRSYKFKSLSMVPDPAGDSKKFSYDMSSVRDHAMNPGAKGFLLCPAWLPNFFLALMAVALVFALAYGLLVIGMKADFAVAAVRAAFIIAAAVLFIILLLALGIPAVVKRLKWDRVVKERGKGSWKIIDEADWERFLRMRKLEEDRLKREEEFRMARK